MRDIFQRLRDIQDAIARLMKYTEEGRDRYDHDELVQTWVAHNLYVIGEALRAMASDFPTFKDQHPEIPWSKIIGLRTVRDCAKITSLSLTKQEHAR
ncbi:MAG TPA: HepT-like ribonuclease domain-containing protein [Ktedonobacteraceae bacterium]|jgi:uncharacterized protein with HEPN domain|nr:HepT-like ribonuclease domain-containing protein [Ktedonobacteraceae bacterium]